MRISRSILLAWVTLAAFSPNMILAQDEDTEAQAKARQALEQKMKELQQAPATNLTAPPAALIPAPATTPTAVPTPETPAVQPTPAQPTPAVTPVPPPATLTPAQPVESIDATDKLSEAVRQKMMELEEQKKSTPAPPVTPAPTTTVQTGAPKNAPPKVEVPPAQPVFSGEPTKPADNQSFETAINAAVEQARAEAEMARKAEAAQPSRPGEPQRVTAPGTRTGQSSRRVAAKPSGPKKFPALPSMESPPSSLTPSQQQRLQDLNRLYFADRITSEQYHEQRARVIAQP